MEKRKAQYDLRPLQDRVRAGNWVVTLTAQKNAWECFRLDVEGVKKVILALEKDDFFKSMTTFHDHSLWQDVYKPLVNSVRAYIKLQEAAAGMVLIQFKGE